MCEEFNLCIADISSGALETYHVTRFLYKLRTRPLSPDDARYLSSREYMCMSINLQAMHVVTTCAPFDLHVINYRLDI